MFLVHTGDLLPTEAGLTQGLANGDATRQPPVLRMLLRPADPGRRERLVVFRRGRDNTPSSSRMRAGVPPVPTSMPSALISLTSFRRNYKINPAGAPTCPHRQQSAGL